MTVNAHLVSVQGPVPAGRATEAELAAEIRATVESPIVQALLEASEDGLLVLNGRRQIVAAQLRQLLPELGPNPSQVLGLRPGEALGCVHACEAADGCGDSETCRSCGALATILECQRSRAPVEGECLVAAGADGLGALELKLRATPIEIDGRPFTVLSVRDVADEKRRAVLEQLFFHDLLNSMSGLSNWAQMLLKVPEARLRTTGERVATLVKRLDAEVRAERSLHLAERGDLVPERASVRPADLLREVAGGFTGSPLALGRHLTVDATPDVEVRTDPALLSRVLGNMAVNALEATRPGGVVRLWARLEATFPLACTFLVHNDGAIPREVAPRIFQRSFSTKAKRGRGLGTYGMKLLGERYLGGEVGFESDARDGTTFWIRLPVKPPEAV